MGMSWALASTLCTGLELEGDHVLPGSPLYAFEEMLELGRPSLGLSMVQNSSLILKIRQDSARHKVGDEHIMSCRGRR